MAYILNASLNLRNRDNSPGGSIVYIAESANVTGVTIDASDEYCTGIGMSGSTKFYAFTLPRENINFTNGAEISVPNGVYIFKPTVTFNLPGLSKDSLKLFDVLVRKSVTIIVKTNELKYFIVGKDNGMDVTSDSNFALGLGGTDLIGSTITLEGLERSRIFEINPTTAAALVASISLVA